MGSSASAPPAASPPHSPEMPSPAPLLTQRPNRRGGQMTAQIRAAGVIVGCEREDRDALVGPRLLEKDMRAVLVVGLELG